MDNSKRTIAKMHPELICWFEDSDIAYNYGPTSKNIVTFICPDCGERETTKIRIFVKRVYHCLNCKQDGISRPNKFLREFLKEIEPQVEFKETEWNPFWAGLYLYDGHIVIDNTDYIIEMHGEQHYHKSSGWDFEYQQKRDAEKAQLAEDNHIEQIIIDCSKTDYGSIKQNIMNSMLSQILDLSNIDWRKIIERCSKNYIKVASDMYSNGMTISDIARNMMFDRHTISKFLLDGNALGWCDYTPIPCTELYKKDIKIINVKTNQETIIHGVNNATHFIENESGFKVDKHTIKDYCNGYRIEYYGGKHVCSLEGKLYKDTYKFERV